MDTIYEEMEIIQALYFNTKRWKNSAGRSRAYISCYHWINCYQLTNLVLNTKGVLFSLESADKVYTMGQASRKCFILLVVE
jgi:hypothetical protein